MTDHALPQTVGDALVKAADRDATLAEQLLGVLELVDRLADDVIALRAQAETDRTAFRRLELRLAADELRARGLELRSTWPHAAGDDETIEPPPDNVVQLIADYGIHSHRVDETTEPGCELTPDDEPEAETDA